MVPAPYFLRNLRGQSQQVLTPFSCPRVGGSGDSVKADVHQLLPSTLRGHREEMDTIAESQLLDSEQCCVMHPA